MALVKTVLENHVKTQMNTDPSGIHYSGYGKEYEGCPECEEAWPCAPYRVANDWLRQHNDLCKAWRNRTGKEIFVVRKFACAVCSEKDSGLICVECIADASQGVDESAMAADHGDDGALSIE